MMAALAVRRLGCSRTGFRTLVAISMLLLLLPGTVARAESIPREAEAALLRADWAGVLSAIQGAQIQDPDVGCRMVTAHACLALNKSNECFALLLGVQGDSAALESWTSWTQQFLNENPRSPVAMYLRADAFARAGKVTDAIRQCDLALAVDASFALAYNARGVLRAISGDLDSSLVDFASALRYAPKLADAHANLGVAYLLLGIVPPDDRVPGFDEALAADPVFALGRNGRGMALFARGDFLEAANEFSTAAALLPALIVAEVNAETAESYAVGTTEGLSDFLESARSQPGMSLSTFMQSWEPGRPGASGEPGPPLPPPAAKQELTGISLDPVSGKVRLEALIKQYGLAAVRSQVKSQRLQAQFDTFELGRKAQEQFRLATRDKNVSSYFEAFDVAASLGKALWDAKGMVQESWNFALGHEYLLGQAGMTAVTNAGGSLVRGEAQRALGYEGEVMHGAISPFTSLYASNLVRGATGLAAKSPLAAAVMSITSSTSELGSRLLDDRSYVHSIEGDNYASQQRVRCGWAAYYARLNAELDNRWVTESLKVKLGQSPEAPPLRISASVDTLGLGFALAEQLAGKVGAGQKVLIGADPGGISARVLQQHLASRGIDAVITYDSDAVLGGGRGISSVVALGPPRYFGSRPPSEPIVLLDPKKRSLMPLWWPDDHHKGGGAVALPGFSPFTAPGLTASGPPPGGVALDFSRALVTREGVWPVATWFGLWYPPLSTAGPSPG